MCAACFAQGSVYVGGALGGLQVMAARAKAKRRRDSGDESADTGADPVSETEDGQPVAWSS